MASTSLAVDMTADFSPSSLGEVTLYMGPHPVIPVVRYDEGASTLRSWFLSEPFGGGVNSGSGTALITVRDAFNAAVESYRILSQSITCTHLGSSTTDGGGVISSQYVSPYQDLAVSYDSRDQNGDWVDRVAPLARIYQNPPSTSTLLSGGRAYVSDARDGVYVPLRLRTLDYESTNNARYLQGNISQSLPLNSARLYEGAVGWPIFFVPQPSGAIVALPNYTSDVFSLTRFTGINSGAKIRVRLRQVIEVIPFPGTAYAPLVQTPPPPDPLALQMYFEVSARSLDAYPASYNDFNTLMRTITSIANKVLPYVDPVLSALSAVPGAPGAIASALRTVGQAIGRRRKRKKDSGAASSAPPPLPPRPKPKGKKLVVRSPPRPR